MARFDATTPDDRRSLVADTIAAHRERGSAFCTVEADSPPTESIPPGRTASDDAESGGSAPETGDEAATNEQVDAKPDTPAWIQFSEPESQLNLDCTDEEYDRITDVLATASAFTIDEQSSPEDADGRNLRITARADADRIADIVDRIFVEGFDYDEDYRLWATEI